MSKKDDNYQDALVDTYRGLREINRKASEPTIATKPITPGAGVDPKKKIRPSKRVKASWRGWKSTLNLSLKAFARRVAATAPSESERAIAIAWLDSKGRP